MVPTGNPYNVIPQFKCGPVDRVLNTSDPKRIIDTRLLCSDAIFFRLEKSYTDLSVHCTGVPTYLPRENFHLRSGFFPFFFFLLILFLLHVRFYRFVPFRLRDPHTLVASRAAFLPTSDADNSFAVGPPRRVGRNFFSRFE